MRTVIVGAGPAGISAAETLRQYDSTMEITIFSREQYQPYSPPAMMEYFLTGKEAHLWRWGNAPQRLNLDYRPNMRITDVIPDDHTIHLGQGFMFHYDNLLITSGSRLYTTMAGSDKRGIYNFKSFFHAKELYDAVCDGRVKDVVIIGAGFIGVEIALLMAYLKVKVTLLEMADQIMPRMLDREIADITCSLLQNRGVEVLVNTKATAYLGKSHAETLELETGERIHADIFVAATGIMPIIGFLKNSGIKVNKGILVNEYLQTNVPHIYAAGDVVETEGRISNIPNLYPIFYNAVRQGHIAALNILGQRTCYEGADSMNSLKHLGLPIITAGIKTGEVLSMKRKRSLLKIFIEGNRIVGYQLAGDIRPAGVLSTLMNKKSDITTIKNLLLDPHFGIGKVYNHYFEILRSDDMTSS